MKKIKKSDVCFLAAILIAGFLLEVHKRGGISPELVLDSLAYLSFTGLLIGCSWVASKVLPPIIKFFKEARQEDELPAFTPEEWQMINDRNPPVR
jgi:hypothetical protein